MMRRLGKSYLQSQQTSALDDMYSYIKNMVCIWKTITQTVDDCRWFCFWTMFSETCIKHNTDILTTISELFEIITTSNERY